MISDLSPGDKLSLKGKIFELQKKLKIIDFETKRQDEFSFRPQVVPYELHSREREANVLDGINKAELIRKQKNELLRAAVLMQNEESCTFTPQINSNSKLIGSVSRNERPVHDRLYSKAKEYEESRERKRMHSKFYDLTNGEKLFSPVINRHNKDNNNSFDDFSEPNNNTNNNNVPVDEFLYQDAKDREQRSRLRFLDAKEEVESVANANKMNTASAALLKKKAEREARMVFNCMDLNELNELTFDDIHRATESRCSYGQLTDEQFYHISEVVWAILDYSKTGLVSCEQFLAIATPLLLHHSIAAAINDVSKAVSLKFSNNPSSISTTSPESRPMNAALATIKSIKQDDYATLKSFLSRLLNSIQSAPRPLEDKSSNKVAPSPKINQHSMKLAQQKKQKERQHIVATILGNSVMINDQVHNQRASSPTPPPPPPTNSSSVVAEKSTELVQALLQDGKVAQHDILIARGIIAKQRKQKLAEDLKTKELSECTFKPNIKPVITRSQANAQNNNNSSQINSNNHVDNNDNNNNNNNNNNNQAVNPPSDPNNNNNNNNLKIFDRLYSLKDKPVEHKHPPRAVTELEGCTFSPNISKLNPSKLNKESVPPIASYEKSVGRIRKANAEKAKQKEFEENESIRNEINYQKSRELAKKGFVPFNLITEQRKDMREQSHKTPRLIIDVKLSASKTAKIQIADGDDPDELANKFGKVYSLDVNAQEVLAQVIRQSMANNNIPFASPTSTLLDSNDNDSISSYGNNNNNNINNSRIKIGHSLPFRLSSTRPHSDDSSESEDISDPGSSYPLP
eukprot:gene4680-6574_t